MSESLRTPTQVSPQLRIRNPFGPSLIQCTELPDLCYSLRWGNGSESCYRWLSDGKRHRRPREQVPRSRRDYGLGFGRPQTLRLPGRQEFDVRSSAYAFVRFSALLFFSFVRREFFCLIWLNGEKFLAKLSSICRCHGFSHKRGERKLIFFFFCFLALLSESKWSFFLSEDTACFFEWACWKLFEILLIFSCFFASDLLLASVNLLWKTVSKVKLPVT